MRRFENYWLEEAKWEAEQNRRRSEKRRRTREERRAKAREQLLTLISVCIFLLVALLATTVYAESVSEEAKKDTQIVDDGRLPGDDVPAVVRCFLTEEEIQADLATWQSEADDEAAVPSEIGYFRDDIPLDFETPAFLRAACGESGVPFELALAVIRKESTYRNITGDGGDSVGYMQVQPKWHRERMRRLGVTDLTQPLANFRVGCDYLAELMDKYPTEEALTAYNSGKPGKSDYADTVLKYWRELR